MTAHELVTEALYVMMRAGAEKTSSPVWANFGIESCMLHGRQSRRPIEAGEVAVIDLTPQVEGYCANLARTFVLGRPDERQQRLIEAYREAVEVARAAMVPGATIARLDDVAHALAEASTIDGFSFDLELLFLARRWGLTVVEHPVDWVDAPGSTVDPTRESVRFLRDIVQIRRRALTGVYPRSMPETAPSGDDAGERPMRLAVVTPVPPSATTLNEFAAASRVGIRLEETALPVRPEVAAACEILGLDPEAFDEADLIGQAGLQFTETASLLLARG